MQLRSCLLSTDERLVNEVFGEKPHLFLIGTDYVADQEVIGAVVAAFHRRVGQQPRFLEDDLVASSRRLI